MKKMFGLVVTLAVFVAIFIATPTPVQAQQAWNGWGKIDVNTWQKSQLEQGSFWNGQGGKTYYQGAEQAGNVFIEGDGGFRANNPDDILVKGSGGYSGGYEQYQKTPAGFQKEWGKQWGEGSVKIKSP